MAEEKRAPLGWAQVASTLLLSAVGLYFTVKFNRQQEQSQRVLGVMQLMSQREQSELDFRQKLFVLVDEKFLNPKVPLANRLASLRLFQQNFNSSLNSRILFDALEIQAMHAPRPER